MVSHYHFAVGILVESGVIYTASTLLVLSLSRTNLILMAATIAIRVVCIVPILIIVQVALGQSTKDVQGTVSMMQGGTPQEVVWTQSSVTVDMTLKNRRRLTNDLIMDLWRLLKVLETGPRHPASTLMSGMSKS
ncbi:hypothetical protein BDZ97DRAFT_1925399 [Flammula alnicola]|nr:hypothetical protein BDZ97DRAFT_1925399 [Flammula alnicola]